MKKTMTLNGKQYDVYIFNTFPSMVEVTLYEVVRPTWKIFRSKFFSTCDGWFYIDDFETLTEGILHILNKHEARKMAENERAEKFKKFIETP